MSIDVSIAPRTVCSIQSPDAHAGADLDDGLGARGGGDHGELRTDGGDTGSMPSSSDCWRAFTTASVSTTDSSTYFQFRLDRTRAPGGNLSTPKPTGLACGVRTPLPPTIPVGMFGLTFEKLLIIGVIAVFLLGPERLPHYAAQLGRLVYRCAT